MSKKKNPFQDAGKILIRSANWVGDAVMSLPAIRAVRAGLPRAEISILAKPWVAGLYEDSADIDHVILYERPGRHQGFSGMWRLSREIRGRSFDAAVLLQNAFEAAWISYVAGIPVRAGFNTDARTLLLSHPVALNGTVKRFHQVNYYLELVRLLGFEIPQTVPFLKTSPPRHREAEEILGRFGLGETGPLVGFSPGASYGSAKEWFPERFGELARRIMGELGGRVLVFGSRGDQRVAAQICAGAGRGVYDLTGKTNLPQAIALISRCRAFVTNDSGLMHVAAALGVPLVAIFGSTDPERTGPLTPSSRVIRKSVPCAPCLKPKCPEDRRCMGLITVDEVYETVSEIWEKNELGI